jgi:hypothetical protein
VLEALLAVQVATGREWDMTGGGDGPGGCLMKGGGGVEGRSVLGGLDTLADEPAQREVIGLAERELRRRGWRTELTEVDSFGGPSVVAFRGTGRVEVGGGVSMVLRGSADCARSGG